MKYRSRTFSVAVNEGSGLMCAEKGHSAPDCRGKCLCCGEKIAPPTGFVVAASYDGIRVEFSDVGEVAR